MNGLFANYCDVIQTDKHTARQRDSVAMEWRTLQIAKKDFFSKLFSDLLSIVYCVLSFDLFA